MSGMLCCVAFVSSLKVALAQSSEIILGSNEFAEYLFRNELYEQSALEYQRVIHTQELNGAAPSPDLYRRLAEAYTMARHGDLALKWLHLGVARCRDSESSIEMRLMSARLLRDGGRYEESLGELESCYQSSDSLQLALCHLERGRAYAVLFRDSEAEREFNSITSPPNLRERAVIYRSGLRKKEEIPNRSRTVAGIMATVPGAGYVYTGHLQTAFSAAIVIGLFGVGSYYSFNKNDNGIGFLLAVFTVGWYSGSIYGSILSADRFNHFYVESYRNNFAR